MTFAQDRAINLMPIIINNNSIESQKQRKTTENKTKNWSKQQMLVWITNHQGSRRFIWFIWFWAC